MTLGGGLSPKQRAALDRGRGDLERRRELKAAGMIAARKWAAEHHPVASREHMPFPGHRNCAGEVWCVECKQLRPVPCRYALCPLAAAASE